MSNTPAPNKLRKSRKKKIVRTSTFPYNQKGPDYIDEASESPTPQPSNTQSHPLIRSHSQRSSKSTKSNDSSTDKPNQNKKKRNTKQYHEIESQNLNIEDIESENQKFGKLPNRKKLCVLETEEKVNKLQNHAAFDFIRCKIGMERKVQWKNFDVMVLIVPLDASKKQKTNLLEIVKKSRKSNAKMYICVIDIEASESAIFRQKAFNCGANMVTNDNHSLKKVLNIIGNKGTEGIGDFDCPYCGLEELTEDELWYHVPLYHINEEQTKLINCPICNWSKEKGFILHLRNIHGPVARGEVPQENKDGILTHAFALVVVRRPKDGKFLVVQESGGMGFWLPGGRVEMGETLVQAALRQTKSEAGIDIIIKGLLKIEHSTYAYDDPNRAFNRMRVFFYAEPKKEKELPKSVPNYESTGATFIDINELDSIVLRASEPREWFTKLTDNFVYHPLDVLTCWPHDHRTNNYNNTRKNRSSQHIKKKKRKKKIT